MNRSLNLHTLLRSGSRVLAAGLLALAAHAEAATGAAEVAVITGVATAGKAGEAGRSLHRGDSVNAGEVISTGANSYVNLAFADGGRVLLRPNTSFEIEAYEYTAPAAAPAAPTAAAAEPAPAPTASRAFFRLARGGFRAISGLIGKQDHQEYLVRTTVATIGIRGTDYLAELCSGDQCLVPQAKLDADLSEALQVGVNEGAIEVTTPKGVYPVEKGQYGLASKDGQFFLMPGAPMSFLLDPLPNPAGCQ